MMNCDKMRFGLSLRLEDIWGSSMESRHGATMNCDKMRFGLSLRLEDIWDSSIESRHGATMHCDKMCLDFPFSWRTSGIHLWNRGDGLR